MIKAILSICILTASILAHAEDVFYNESARISFIDCETGKVVLNDNRKTTLDVRLKFVPGVRYPYRDPRNMCYRLENVLGQKKSVTLLTAPLKKSDDLIEFQEVIGFADVDYVVALWDPNSVNKIFQDGPCGHANRSTTVCVWNGVDAKNTFITIDAFTTGTSYYSTKQEGDGSFTFINGSDEPKFTYNLKVDPQSDGTYIGTLKYDGQKQPQFEMRKRTE